VRLRALVLAVYINCGLLALSLALVYGFAFVAVMAANLYSTLLVYIVTFRVLMFAGRR